MKRKQKKIKYNYTIFKNFFPVGLDPDSYQDPGPARNLLTNEMS